MPFSHFAVAKEESGISVPLPAGTVKAKMSSGCIRDLADACTITRCKRPSLGKSLT